MKAAKSAILIVFPLLFCAATSQTLATTINFEGAVPPGGSMVTYAYQESGYKLTTSGDSLHIASRTSPNISGVIPLIEANEDVAAGFGSNNNTTTLTIVRDNGGLFNLSSADVLSLKTPGFPTPTNFSYHVTGFKSDLVFFDSAFYDIDGQWHSLSFSDDANYENLTKLSISVTSDQPMVFVFDNINVSEVPLPASTWLFGSSLLGLASLRKKRDC